MSEHNVVVLRGTVVTDTTIRELPSGSIVIQFDVTTRDDAGTQSVPVAWLDPPATGRELGRGSEVVVVGSVRRRFFRAGGNTQSRTEVVAEHVVAGKRGRPLTRVLDGVRRQLDPG